MEKIVRKGEVACNNEFLLFSQYFFSKYHLFFTLMHFKMLSIICFNSDQSKISLSGIGLKIARKPIKCKQLSIHAVKSEIDDYLYVCRSFCL